jgi:serine/threonine protein kinase
VLIDDREIAVLSDFGLVNMQADVTNRTASLNGGPIVGSRNWMAPELLLGGSLKKPCDIYAFSMTLYEVSADCIALNSVILTHRTERFIPTRRH